MRTSRALAKQVVSAYAEALYEAASGTGTVDAVGAQLRDVLATTRGHAALRDVLVAGAVPVQTRAGIVREIFASYDAALVAVLGLMAEREEFELLSSVSEAFVKVAEERRNMVAVEVTTAVALTDDLRDRISAKLAADMGTQVVLQEQVDPSIIGGIVISAHGRRIDASIVSQLEAARVALSNAHTGGEA